MTICPPPRASFLLLSGWTQTLGGCWRHPERDGGFVRSTEQAWRIENERPFDTSGDTASDCECGGPPGMPHATWCTGDTETRTP